MNGLVSSFRYIFGSKSKSLPLQWILKIKQSIIIIIIYSFKKLNKPNGNIWYRQRP